VGPPQTPGGGVLREKILAEAGEPSSPERDLFPGFCRLSLYAIKLDVPFIDTGTPETWRAGGNFLAALKRETVPP
jgi:NDP-sugar pyrophosphorylase family protein